MKEFFWQSVLGLVLLLAVAAIAVNPGGLALETESILEKAVSLSGTEWFFKGERKTVKSGEGNQPVIVIDAGHGGNDPGKVGVDGQLEKEINLKIVRRLQTYLEMNGITVVLTRENDKGLYQAGDKNKKSADMKKRIEIINQVNPRLMVSIHQNSYHQPEISGAQVFYFGKSEEGKIFAQIMQKRFDYVLGEEKNTRQAKANGNYYLLTHSKPVSIIIEGGFLSNPQEAKKLETEEYQDKIAWTVAMGILQYMNRDNY
mgnify:FL=1